MTYSTVKKKLAIVSSLLSYACQDAPCDFLAKYGTGWPCCEDNCPIKAAKRFIHEKEEELEKDETLD